MQACSFVYGSEGWGSGARTLYVLNPTLQRIDHFSWAATPNGASKYKQRFFVSFDNWRNDSTGCVFFYLGNEADVSLCV